MTERPTHIRITNPALYSNAEPGHVYLVERWWGEHAIIRIEEDATETMPPEEWEPVEAPDPLVATLLDIVECANIRAETVSRTDTPYPDDNPKTALGYVKPSLRAVPPIALFRLGLVMAHGEAKYGRFNYRAKRITASTYYDAAMRHLTAWHDGEDTDPESGQPHLAHVMACCAIALDAAAMGKMNDDRTAGPLPAFLAAESAK